MLLLNLGQESYEHVWELQHRLVKARQEGRVDDILILLEHEPVITLGRVGDPAHILASVDELLEADIRVYRIERGGDVTYHGPGQLVGYPIVRLDRRCRDVHRYIRRLEEVLIRLLRPERLVNPEAIISHRFPLSEIHEAMAVMAQPDRNKVMVQP